MRAHRTLPIVLLLAIAVVPERAAAGSDKEERDARDEEARGLFVAGRAAYDDGRYEEALDYFRRSYELSERPELLYNIGQTSDVLGRNDEALLAFEKYQESYPDGPRSREVQERIFRLRKAQQAPEQSEAEAGSEEEAEEAAEEEEAGDLDLGLDCGAHVLLGYLTVDRPALGIGLGAQGRFGVTFTPQIMAELSAAVVLNQATETDEDVLDLGVRAGGRYLFVELRPLVPFLGAGLTVHRWSATRISLMDGSEVGVNDVNASLDLMGGARFDILDHWAAEAILQVATLFESAVFYDRGGTAFTLALGFVYYI